MTAPENDATGACNSGTTTTKAWTYDLSSRVLTAGDGVGQYEYDLLGRVTSMPEADAPVSDAAGDNPVTLGYFASDDIYSIAQGGVETSFTIDPLGRRLVETTTTGSMVANTLTRHYTDSSDNPSWIVENTETTRYTPALGSGLGAVVYPDAHIELTLDDPHGDIITTVELPTTGVVSGITGWSMFDEYGNALTGLADTGAATYGWVGSQERATLDNGLILMGARVYNSVTGRFLSPDPVAGGNENSYNYPNDPVNRFDTTGLFDWGLALDIGLLVLSFVPGLGVAALAAKVVITAVRIISAVSKVQKVAKVVRTIGNAVKRTSNALKVKTPKKTANSCRANSFVPGTGVLMADHSTKPIEDVALGDLVLATDPLTGETVAQEVTDLIIGRGSKDLVTISIDTNLDGVFEEVVATHGHPFWTDLRGWVDAGDLVVGDQLRGDSGELIAVTGVAAESRIAIVYNLTVANFHTYYVMIADQEALTHNCNIAKMNRQISKGQAPRGIKRIDKEIDSHGGSVHAHVNGGAIRTNGTIKHPLKSPVTNNQRKWLKGHGWTL